MTEQRVLTELYRLDRVLGLLRGRPGGDVSAVLVIPRGGRLRTPRLLTFASPGEPVDRARRSPREAHVDSHTVARFDTFEERDRRATADVLIGRATRPSVPPAVRLRRVLEHYPGCAVAVGETSAGRLATVRGRWTVTTSGPLDAQLSGSLLYAWTVARLPLAALTDGLVIAGRRAGPDALEVAGRVTVEPLVATGGRRAS